MPSFNYQAAKAAGYSDAQINAFLSQVQSGGQPTQTPDQSPAPAAPTTAPLNQSGVQALMAQQPSTPTPAPAQPDQGSFGGYVGDLASHSGEDIKNTLSGLGSLLSLPIRAITGQADLGQVASGALDNVINEYKDLATNPGKHFYEHPVNSVLDLLPLAQAGKAAVVGKAAETGTAAKAAEAGSELGNASKVQNLAEGASELVNGGGPKDFIARNVNLDDSRTLSKTLLDNQILSAPTEKGRIISTQKALTDWGLKLDKILGSSPATIDSNQLMTLVGDTLKQSYPESQSGVIDDVMRQLSKEGSFDIGTQASPISMSQLNKIKTGLMDFGLKSINVPGAGPLTKQMAEDAARVIRNHIAEQVPQATDALREYGNLKTYLNDVLTDPKGLTGGGMLDSVKGNLKTLANIGTQKLYDTQPGLPNIKDLLTSKMDLLTSKKVQAGLSSRYMPPIGQNQNSSPLSSYQPPQEVDLPQLPPPPMVTPEQYAKIQDYMQAHPDPHSQAYAQRQLDLLEAKVKAESQPNARITPQDKTFMETASTLNDTANQLRDQITKTPPSILNSNKTIETLAKQDSAFSAMAANMQLLAGINDRAIVGGRVGAQMLKAFSAVTPTTSDSPMAALAKLDQYQSRLIKEYKQRLPDYAPYTRNLPALPATQTLPSIPQQ